MDKKAEDFYTRLKKELENTTQSWPANYLYKFIVPNTPEKINEIKNIFDGLNAKIQIQTSKNGKYASNSISVKMNSADEIIKKYQQASLIEGIISL